MLNMKFLIHIWMFGFIFLSVTCGDSPCNDYVDKLLRDLKDEKELFQDPYPIPEKSYKIHKKVIFINYTAEARLFDGYIFGLPSLHRDGDVIVDQTSRTHLKLFLGAGELKLQCKGTVKLMGYGPQVTVHATLAYVNMKLDIVPTSNGTHPHITNFNIEDVKGKDVQVTGLGPLNFMLNSYIKVIVKFFKNRIRSTFEKRLKDFMEKRIKDYIIPQECIEDTYGYYL